MNNLDYVKLVATVSKSVSKETILSKLINFVTVFRVNLADRVFDDYHKKYIDTILKLDNSKTIMLETKGEEVKVKNTHMFDLVVGDGVIVDFSEFREDHNDAIYINYGHIPEIPSGTHIGFLRSDLVLKVDQVRNDKLYCTVDTAGKIQLHSVVKFIDYKPKLSFLSEKDKKNVMWGLKSGVNMLAASSVKTADDIRDLRKFLERNDGEDIKLFTRLHTISAYTHLDDIIAVSDGLILSHGATQEYLPEDCGDVDDFVIEQEIIQACKLQGKPVILCIDGKIYQEHKKNLDAIVLPYKKRGVDAFMVTDQIIDEENPLDDIMNVYESITQDVEPIDVSKRLATFYHNDHRELGDYILYSAYRVTKELDIKAIICYTNNGVTAAKLASLASEIPVIAFTKNDAVYRYINMLWGVRGYKISQAFNDTSLKRIGKEMIRIIFKGNISLDDKVMIVQTQEMDKGGQYMHIINGVEVYKFKNI